MTKVFWGSTGSLGYVSILVWLSTLLSKLDKALVVHNQ